MTVSNGERIVTANDVKLDVLGVERAHIVGRSMAGAIALVAGVDHPDRVASLTYQRHYGTCSPPHSSSTLHKRPPTGGAHRHTGRVQP
jgi:pimeloyl-ACP methyl ester carboxylesterase